MKFKITISAFVFLLISGITGGSDAVEEPKPLPLPSEIKPGEMVFVPAGDFVMGSSKSEIDEALKQYSKYGDVWLDRKDLESEQPQRKVFLDAYDIDKFEVTVQQYRECITAGKCSKPDPAAGCDWGETESGNDKLPMICVDWNQADTFCKWAEKRLPSEAEWEKAARGSDGRIYPWGGEQANCSYAVMWSEGGYGCGKGARWPIGSKPAGASPYGAMDMSGNVCEWVADRHDKNYYKKGASRNPTGPSTGTQRVYRGGGWYNYPVHARAAMRFAEEPSKQYNVVGFRCAKTP